MKASILIVTYNHEKYIRQALESILMQENLPEHEIILCDDHSSDKTVSIAEELFSGQSAFSVYVNEKNLGITKNYQQAFKLCQGEYIFVLEGDDYWTDRNKVNIQVGFMDSHSGCAACAHPFIIQKDEELQERILPDQHEGHIFFDGEKLILDEGTISNFSTCCYRNDMLKKITPALFEIVSYEWIVNIAISEFGSLARINRFMSVYRHSGSGAWTGISPVKQLEGMHDIIPVYDQALGYRFHKAFYLKKRMLKSRLEVRRGISGSIFSRFIRFWKP